MGFINLKSDGSIFIHNTSSSFTVMLVYVDDIILIRSNLAIVKKFTSLLKEKFLLKDLDD